MFEKKSQQILRVMIFSDISLTILSYILSFWFNPIFPQKIEADFFSHFSLLPLITSLLMLSLPYFKAYDGPRGTSIFMYAWSVTRAIALSIAVLLTLLFFLKVQYVSRYVIFMFAGSCFIFLVGIRILVILYFRKSIKKGEHSLNVLIIGTGARAVYLSEKLLEHSEWGIDIIGYIDPDPERVGMQMPGSKVIGTVNDIISVLKHHVVDEVIIAITRNMIGDVEEIAHECEEEGVKLRFMADVFDLNLARITLVDIDKIPLLTLEPVAQDEVKLIIKRIFDLTLTLISMPILLPLMGLIAIVIKIDSPGSVFYLQERVGLKKRVFKMIKFRSMEIGADKKLKEIEHLNEAKGPIFKMGNDPRVTRVGKFIRKTSLDEFPQLFNVVNGDMSLVGPRPMSIRDVNLFNKGIQRKRFSVTPGITCIWQISGRSNLPFEKWLELDLEYIENWTLWLDLKILIKTIPVVLVRRGAL